MTFYFIVISINAMLCSLHSLSQTRTQETESLKTQMSDLQKRYQDGIKVNMNIQIIMFQATCRPINWKLLLFPV